MAPSFGRPAGAWEWAFFLFWDRPVILGWMQEGRVQFNAPGITTFLRRDRQSPHWLRVKSLRMQEPLRRAAFPGSRVDFFLGSPSCTRLFGIQPSTTRQSSIQQAGQQPAVPGLGPPAACRRGGNLPKAWDRRQPAGQGQSPNPHPERPPAASSARGKKVLGTPKSSSARGNLTFFHHHRLDCPWPTRTSALPGKKTPPGRAAQATVYQSLGGDFKR